MIYLTRNIQQEFQESILQLNKFDTKVNRSNLQSSGLGEADKEDAAEGTQEQESDLIGNPGSSLKKLSKNSKKQQKSDAHNSSVNEADRSLLEIMNQKKIFQEAQSMMKLASQKPSAEKDLGSSSQKH